VKKYIAIDLQEMHKNKLTMHEWTLLECVLYSSNNEFNSCFASRQKLADHIGVSKRKMYNLIDDLVGRKWLKKLSNNYLKVTEKWTDINTVPMVQNMHNEGAKNALPTYKKEYKGGVPTEDEVISMGKQLKIDEKVCTNFYLYYEAKGWKGILDYIPLLRKWNMNEKPKTAKQKFTDASTLELI